MFSAFAATAPRAMQNSVSLPRPDGITEVLMAPGSSAALFPTAETIAAPALSSTTQERKTPIPALIPAAQPLPGRR